MCSDGGIWTTSDLSTGQRWQVPGGAVPKTPFRKRRSHASNSRTQSVESRAWEMRLRLATVTLMGPEPNT